MERWPLTNAAIESVLRQTRKPLEIIVAVDHNQDLLERLRARWQTNDRPDGPTITVIPSVYDGRQAASATTAAELARGTFLAFLDDDASAEPEWLELLLDPFADPSVVAVGGAPLPVYEKPRPGWLPHQFNWVFGCAYEGLPTKRAPIHHLIGTTMATRTSDFLAVGGIRHDDFPDLELSHRLVAAHPGGRVIYEPNAIVRHFVPATRLTWSYFWRRCFFVNRKKVDTMRDLGPAGHLGAERGFVARALTRGVIRGVGDAARGDMAGLQRAGAIFAGVALAGAGYATRRLEHLVRRPSRGPGPFLSSTTTGVGPRSGSA
jgi:GT2 family glycosyltransferase